MGKAGEQRKVPRRSVLPSSMIRHTASYITKSSLKPISLSTPTHPHPRSVGKMGIASAASVGDLEGQYLLGFSQR